MTTTQEMLLQIDYSIILAYVAGGLICFFTLSQIAMNVKKSSSITYKSIITLMAFTTFVGVIIFTFASYVNYKEATCLQEKLKINKEGESCLEGRVSTPEIATLGCWGFGLISSLVFFYILYTLYS